MFTLKWTGVERFEQSLKRLTPAVDAALLSAMEQAANEIVGMMKRLAPVYEGSKTSGRLPPGALRDSIGWTWGDPPAGVRLVGKSKKASNGKRITLYAGGKGIPEAIFMEFGLRLRELPAQPFFYVSWRANKKRTRAMLRRVVKKAIKENY